MVSKFNRSLLATLVLGLAVTGSSARAETAEAASLSGSAALNAYDNCIANICVGMTVRIVGGEWAGHAGQVISVNEYYDQITVVNSSGYTLTPRTYDVIADMTQPSSTGCVANICIGDQVRVLVGAYAGSVGTVVDADDYNYTATILIGGRYLIEDVRDLTLSIRPTTYRPYGNYPRNCMANYYVYDIYRGCVRITYSYPRPYIVRSRPVGPRYYPAPRHMPTPPRYYPNPRGPMNPPRGHNGTTPAVPRYPSSNPTSPNHRNPSYPNMPSNPRGPSQNPRGPTMNPHGPSQSNPRGPSQNRGPQGPSRRH